MTEAEQGVPRKSAAARDNTGAAQTPPPTINPNNKQSEVQTNPGSFADDPSGETQCPSKPFVCIYYNTMLITGFYIL